MVEDIDAEVNYVAGQSFFLVRQLGLEPVDLAQKRQDILATNEVLAEEHERVFAEDLVRRFTAEPAPSLKVHRPHFLQYLA